MPGQFRDSQTNCWNQKTIAKEGNEDYKRFLTAGETKNILTYVYNVCIYNIATLQDLPGD